MRTEKQGIDPVASREEYLGLETILAALSKDDDVLEPTDEDDDLVPWEELFEHLAEEYNPAPGSEEDSDINVETLLEGARVDDPLALYLGATRRVALLTQEEEGMLARHIEQAREAKKRLLGPGDVPENIPELQDQINVGEAARRRFIEANTRLVINIAKRYRGYGLPFLDLIQAGNLGLIKAVDRFDYRLGNKFSTYATWWIRQSITRTLTQHGHTIRLPSHVRGRLRKYRQAARKLEKRLGRTPTTEEVAGELGISDVRRVRRLLQVAQQPLSLNTLVGEEDDSELGSFIEDEKALSTTQTVERQMIREDLRQVIAAVLAPREIQVLSMHFGLDGYRKHTLKEIGEQLEVSRERIRQIEHKALRKLRHPSHRRKLRNYWR